MNIKTETIRLIAEILNGIQVPASINPTFALGTGARSWSELLDKLGPYGIFGWKTADDYEKALRQIFELEESKNQ